MAAMLEDRTNRMEERIMVNTGTSVFGVDPGGVGASQVVKVAWGMRF